MTVAGCGIATAQVEGSSSEKNKPRSDTQSERLTQTPSGTQQPNTEIPQAKITLISKQGRYPVLVDGQPMGETSPEGHKLLLSEGQHVFEVGFPDGVKWKQSLFTSSVNKNCTVRLDYRQSSSTNTPGYVNPTINDCGGVSSDVQVSAGAGAGTRCTRIANVGSGTCPTSAWCLLPSFLRPRGKCPKCR